MIRLKYKSIHLLFIIIHHKWNIHKSVFRFALKRHRNIHEKYGRTKPQTTTASSDDGQVNNSESVNSTSNVATGTQDGEHEEIVEAKYEQKYETVDGSDMGEEISDISELQVQLQWETKIHFNSKTTEFEVLKFLWNYRFKCFVTRFRIENVQITLWSFFLR